jgi:hypothetical protein
VRLGSRSQSENLLVRENLLSALIGLWLFRAPCNVEDRLAMSDQSRSSPSQPPQKPASINNLRPNRQKMSRSLQRKAVQENDVPKIGYKKPPPDSRFQKGQSGNPNGRPKGSKNKPKMEEGAYHLQMALYSGIISVKRPQKPKLSTKEKYFKKRSSEDFPRKEHCSFDDYMKIVTISGPMNKEEDEKWQGLLKKEYDLMDDRIWQLEAVISARDDYTRKEMQAAADFTQSLLLEVREQKEKFTRRMKYQEFERLVKPAEK